MKKRKTMLSLLLVFVLTMSLAACGGGQGADPAANGDGAEASVDGTEAGDQIVLDVWHYFSAQDGDRFAETCEQYSEVNPKVRINATYISREDLMKQYTMGAVSGELPDIGMVDNPDHASFAAMGVFEEISSYFTDEDLAPFYEGPLASCEYDGGLYGLPHNSNCIAIFINDELFEEAGLEHPTTWDELMDCAEALTDPANGVYGMAMCAKNDEEGTFQYMPFLLSSVATLDELDSANSVRALQFLTDMVQNGYMSQDIINWTQSDVNTQFISGNAAMQLNGPWQIPQLAQDAPDLEYSCIIVPKDEKYASVLGGENFAVCSGSDYTDEAVEFLTWMNSAEISADFCEAAGKFPPRSDSMQMKALWTDDPVYSVFGEQMEYAMPRGPHPRWPEISSAISSAVSESLTGVKTPEEAMAEAASKYDALMAE